MRRRNAIALLGAAATWPRGTGAEPLRRIAMLLASGPTDPEEQTRSAAFRNGLEALGWTEGRNVEFLVRYQNGDPTLAPSLAAEIVGLSPDVILAESNATVRALKPLTRTIPIVFVRTSEPVAAGFVTSIARPGGNITGFVNYPPTINSKWIQLLKEIAPNVSRVTVIYNPGLSANASLATVAAARSLGMNAVRMPLTAMADFQKIGQLEARSGVIVMPDFFTALHKTELVAAIARRHLIAVYPLAFFAPVGGLVCYATDPTESFRAATSYVDRILRGANPGDLPIQYPTTFALTINLKAARDLGLTIPQSLLLRADTIIK